MGQVDDGAALRPMSSMTKEERQEYGLVLCGELSINQYDWLNAHHFDYKGLIGMAAITEDYCSFEIAKLLEEKGFDIPVWTRYEENNDEVIFGDKYNWNNSPMGQISAPTLQMAMKWLRKKHNININIVPIWNQNRFEYQVFIVTPENAKHCYIDDNLYLVYEEAVEAALKYSLKNLI